MEGPVRALLRREMMRRINDGWDTTELTDDRLTMVHAVTPPWGRIVVDFVNPFSWLLGPTWPQVERALHVWVGDAGAIQRRTTGDIPRRWVGRRVWEVPDGEASE